MTNRLGEVLRCHRKRKGLTQAEAGKKLDSYATTIGNYERGERVPDIYTIKDLADIYEVKVWDLIEEVFRE